MSVATRPVPLRDFTGGLNNVADMSAIEDKELSLISNLELDSNGSLVSRPPIVKIQDFPAPTLPAEQLGFFSRADGVNFIVYAHNGKTYLYEPVAGTFTQITTFAASGCAQYQNRLYLCARTTRGGWWGETVVASGVYTYQSLAGGATPMPFGDQIVTYKDRLWIAGWGNSDELTKVYLSDITNTTGGDINNWPLLNFIYVSRGDGQWITKLHAGSNDLTILRSASAYYFHYDSDPVLGTLSRYEGNIGTENKYTTATYQNYLYTLCNGGLYQLIGYQFYRRNDPEKLRFYTRDTTTPYAVNAAISVIGSRCVIWYMGETYTLNLNTLVWSQWDSPTTQAAMFRTIPRAQGYFGVDVAYGITGSGEASKNGVYRIIDEIDNTNKETMLCKVRTKSYDYSTPDRYKTLFWWSLDALTAGSVTGTAVPIVLATSVTTYDDLDALLGGYDQMDLASWDNLTFKSPSVSTVRTNPSTFPTRPSYKFIKKLRFRRIYYEVAIDFDGSLATGPVHIFGLVSYVEVKQKTTKGVS